MKRVLFATAILIILFCVSCGPNQNAAQLQLTQTGTEPSHIIKETILMNNCGGKAEAEQVAQRDKSYSIEGDFEIGMDYKVVQGAVTAKYAEMGSSSKSQKLIAPAGTNMEFVLAWTEESYIGLIASNISSSQAKYRVTVPVSVALESSRDLGCPSLVNDSKPTSLPTEITRATQEPAYNLNQQDYGQSTIDETVPTNNLLCLTTGPIIVQNIKEPIQFPGAGRGSVVCWIGAQRAQAYNLAGSSLKHVNIISGDPEQIALSLVMEWGQEMTSNSDGCGQNYGPCKVADLAVIRSDGSVIKP